MADLTRSGDRVSGDVESPCPQAVAPASEAGASHSAAPASPLSQIELTPAERFVSRQSERIERVPDLARYGRMIRPFPVRALSDALYHVQADATMIAHVLTGVQIDPPQMADTWCEALYVLDDLLVSLADRALAARAQLVDMVDRADAEEARGLSALRAVMAGV